MADGLDAGIPGMRYAWDEVQSLAVVDDNHLPYLSIPIARRARPIPQKTSTPSLWRFPEKVFYPADAR